ncbi:MAG: hypothetical protein EBZ47_07615 [Chlamydiae bacterium]|nr:hypothetical protein [Chlamydiota bacterium]
MLVTISSVKAQDKIELPSQNKDIFYNIQDRPNPTIDDPLNGLSKFLFFPMFPSKDKSMADKIYALVEKKLSVLGEVNKTRLIVDADQQAAVDLGVFSTGTTLIYKIENLKDLSGKDTGFVRASLNLSAAVQVVKTNETCSPYIWSCNCFLKGSTKKTLESLVSTSLDELLKQFSESYSLVNYNKPVFELQGGNS